MRRKARIDANHGEVVKALRAVGCSVQSLAAIGSGCPDLLVGFRGSTFLIEVKDGGKPASERRLTPDQELWRFRWNGDGPSIATSPQEALRIIGL